MTLTVGDYVTLTARVVRGRRALEQIYHDVHFRVDALSVGAVDGVTEPVLLVSAPTGRPAVPRLEVRALVRDCTVVPSDEVVVFDPAFWERAEARRAEVARAHHEWVDRVLGSVGAS